MQKNYIRYSCRTVFGYLGLLLVWKLNFPDKKYQIIYADPPFNYNIERDKAVLMGSAKNHYDTMSLEDICNLPVQQIADKNCYLFLWCSSPTLQNALEVMQRWGFSYRTIAFVWSKTNREMGVGYYTRPNHEFVLLGRKGALKIKSHKVKQWIKAPTTTHSKKPNEVRNRILQLLGDLQRIELFSRTKALGKSIDS